MDEVFQSNLITFQPQSIVSLFKLANLESFQSNRHSHFTQSISLNDYLRSGLHQNASSSSPQARSCVPDKDSIFGRKRKTVQLGNFLLAYGGSLPSRMKYSAEAFAYQSNTFFFFGGKHIFVRLAK
jgi:hypothetical protein